MNELAAKILINIDLIKQKALWVENIDNNIHLQSHLFYKHYRIPLPELANGKNYVNELDRKYYALRVKSLKSIATKCEQFPDMEFRLVVEELENILKLLDKIEQEVMQNIF